MLINYKFSQGHNYKADYWSLGVIFFSCYSGAFLSQIELIYMKNRNKNVTLIMIYRNK